jgi:hypothetical protein
MITVPPTRIDPRRRSQRKGMAENAKLDARKTIHPDVQVASSKWI